MSLNTFFTMILHLLWTFVQRVLMVFNGVMFEKDSKHSLNQGVLGIQCVSYNELCVWKVSQHIPRVKEWSGVTFLFRDIDVIYPSLTQKEVTGKAENLTKMVLVFTEITFTSTLNLSISTRSVHSIQIFTQTFTISLSVG